jgi:hypothetical protein
VRTEVIRPTTDLTLDQYAQALDVPTSTVRQWQRPGGPLFGAERSRGVYGRGDVLIGLVVLELQHILGNHSERVNVIVEQIAPRLRTWANTGQVPETFKLQIGDSPTEATIDVSPFALLDTA